MPVKGLTLIPSSGEVGFLIDRSNQDFWWYYIAQAEAGNKDFAQAVVTYRANFAIRGRRFKEGLGDVADA